MIKLIIAFLIGCLYTRTYYARINKQTDWMKSFDWFDNKYWKKLHLLGCELCPKRWYCKRYEIEKLHK